MAISRACYCSRSDVARAVGIKFTARSNSAIDRAIQTASDNIDGQMHRVFYPTDTTKFIDWPNFQRAYPWRLWFDQWELADVTTNVPVVTSGTTVIPSNQIFWGPWNYSPPFTFLELDRSSTASFGASTTPQRSVSIKGTFGYWIQTDPAGTLAVAMTDTTSTTAVTSNGALLGPGNVLLVDSERMIVSDVATVDSTATLTSGGTTALASDSAITISSGPLINVTETILIDSERMYVVDVTGNVITVIRAWDGTQLATHSAGAHLFAYRTYTVVRGSLGSTAATHLINATASSYRIPFLIKDLAIGESAIQVAQELGLYSDPQGESAMAIHGISTAIADKWDEAETRYGRIVRSRVV